MSTDTNTTAPPFDPFDRDDFMAHEWPEALRSGEFKQGEGVLARYVSDEASPLRYCCLGVACELLYRKGLLKKRSLDGERIEYVGDFEIPGVATLPPSAARLLEITPSGLMDDGRSNLVELNDSGTPFDEIASVIEESYRSGKFIPWRVAGF